MFSSSAPVYLDHPNWHQLQQQDHQQGCGSQNYQLQPPGLPPPPPQVGGGGMTTKPISMVDRARIAKVLQPEAGLKCPRCESSNTKFCYFNNYNLSQPRHFCKTCRRYWTRGGSLRNIPVGGGCRKNKRSKSKSSKYHQVINTSASNTPSRCSTETPNHFPTLSPIMDSLHNFGGGNMGIGGFQSKIEVEGGGGGGGGETSLGFQSGNSGFLSVGGAEQWRLPFLTDLGPPAKLFQFQSHEGVEARSGNSNTQLAPVKMEENLLGLNLSREFMGVSENNDQFWVANQWREI